MALDLPVAGGDKGTWGLKNNTALSGLDVRVLALESSGHGIPSGGNAKDILVKASATDYDAGWQPSRKVFVAQTAPPAGSGQDVGDIWIKVAV